jgi:acyl-CoA synthetase (AMP-forming)/AMP-acid ligase II
MIWDFFKYNNNICAVTEDGRTFTYAELAEAGAKFADAVGGRKLIFILCTNTFESVAAYTGALNHGIVPLLLAADIDKDLLKNLKETYKPAYIYAPALNTAPALSSSGALPSLSSSGLTRGSLTDTTQGGATTTCAYQLTPTDYETPYPLHPDLALLLTTSGSTGSPKLVRQTYANVKANTESIIKYLEITEEERAITTLPMNYTYGLSIINTHLYAGATMLLTDRSLIEKEFWEFFKNEKATSFGGVPYTYEMLEKLRFLRMDLPSLKTMTQAGGKLSPALHKQFAEYAQSTHKRFVVMYGQAEATARMSYLPPERSIEKFGSIGIAIPGGKLTLIDAEGRRIETPDTVGELEYEGANVTPGYAEKGEDLAKGDEREGKLITGDMAKMDADGYFYIAGRKKRFLKIYGNRVNLDETERLIKEKFTEADCACAGEDDHMKVYITDETLAEAVRTYISEKTNLNRAAFTVLPIKEIPRNPSGKIQYGELQ